MSDIPEHEKPVAFKYTHGRVRQDFVDGRCVGQQFIVGDQVDWENEVGDPIKVPDYEAYQPFDMKQPGAVISMNASGVDMDAVGIALLRTMVNAHAEGLALKWSIQLTMIGETDRDESQARAKIIAEFKAAGIPFEVQDG